MKKHTTSPSPSQRSPLPWQAAIQSATGQEPLPPETAAKTAEVMARARPWLILVAALIMLAALYPIVSRGQEMVKDGRPFGWLVTLAPLLLAVVGMVTVKRRIDHVIDLLRRGGVSSEVPTRPPTRRRETVSSTKPRTVRPGGDGNGLGKLLVFALIAGCVIWQPWKRENLPDTLLQTLHHISRQFSATVSREARTTPSPAARHPTRAERFEDLARRVGNAPSPCPELVATQASVARANDRNGLNQRLKDALLCKIQRPGYQQARAERLLDLDPPFPEEAFIRALRDRLARLRPPPGGIDILKVPSATRPPIIDGVLEPGEWKNALTLEVPGTHSRILLTRHRNRLFVAGDVRDQTTPHPWHSLRLILHEHLSPWLDEEYVFVYGRGALNAGCRISQVKWPGPPPPGGFPDVERWKRYRINECGLYHLVRGSSTLRDHRIYEVSVDLAEAGIPRGHPFPLRLEIEDAPEETVDPATGRRKFRRRRYIGPLSPGTDPWKVWLVLD